MSYNSAQGLKSRKERENESDILSMIGIYSVPRYNKTLEVLLKMNFPHHDQVNDIWVLAGKDNLSGCLLYKEPEYFYHRENCETNDVQHPAVPSYHQRVMSILPQNERMETAW